MAYSAFLIFKRCWLGSPVDLLPSCAALSALTLTSAFPRRQGQGAAGARAKCAVIFVSQPATVAPPYPQVAQRGK